MRKSTWMGGGALGLAIAGMTAAFSEESAGRQISSNSFVMKAGDVQI
jgi:hypothetical protein